MTTFQFVSVIVLATYFTGVIGIVRELIEEMKNPDNFAKVLFNAMPLPNQIIFHICLFTIGPFLWFASRMSLIGPKRKKRA